MSKIPPNDVLESLFKLRIRESDQLKSVLELYDLQIHQKISKQDYQNLKRWSREAWIRNSDYETLTPDTGKSKKGQLSRIERDEVVLKEEKVCPTSGKKKANVRKEIIAVSGTMKISVQIRHQNPLRPVNCRHKDGRSTSRRTNLRGWSPSWKLSQQPFRDSIKR